MRRRPLAVAAALLPALVLVGCSTPLPVPSPEPVPATAPPALDVAQVERILTEVQASLEQGDGAQDANQLQFRFSGPARLMREAEYRLAAQDEAETLTEIPTEVQTVVVPTTTEWPRHLVVVTEPPADLQAPLVLVLVQSSPRAQFEVWSWARLFPGTEVPATMQPEVGSAPVDPQTDALAVPMDQLFARYADTLAKGAKSKHAKTFTENPLSEGIVETRQAFRRLVGENGRLTETYEPLDTGPYAVHTADGGALVTGAFRTKTTITLDDSTLTIGDETARLLGKRKVEKNLAITYLSVVVLAVPPAGSEDPVQVIGAEHTRTEVTGR